MQEVSCYIDYNISMASENEWKVDIVNTHMTGSDRWHAINSQVSSHLAKYTGCPWRFGTNSRL